MLLQLDENDQIFLLDAARNYKRLLLDKVASCDRLIALLSPEEVIIKKEKVQRFCQRFTNIALKEMVVNLLQQHGKLSSGTIADLIIGDEPLIEGGESKWNRKADLVKKVTLILRKDPNIIVDNTIHNKYFWSLPANESVQLS